MRTRLTLIETEIR